MNMTQIMHDTVHLMEGGHIARTRRPGERFDVAGTGAAGKSKERAPARVADIVIEPDPLDLTRPNRTQFPVNSAL